MYRLRFFAFVAATPFVLASSLALFAGCSAPSNDAADQSDEDLTLKPKDFDPLTQARVTVRIPSGYAAPASLRKVLAVTPTGTSTLEYGVAWTGRAGAWKLCFG